MPEVGTGPVFPFLGHSHSPSREEGVYMLRFLPSLHHKCEFVAWAGGVSLLNSVSRGIERLQVRATPHCAVIHVRIPPSIPAGRLAVIKFGLGRVFAKLGATV